MAKAKNTPSDSAKEKENKRSYFSQADVPSMTLDKAIKLAKAIVDNYASKPSTPLQVAKALDILPTSSSFRMLCGASIAYGLTKGGYAAETIELLPLASRILKPKKENDDILAKIEAFMSPRVVKEFLSKYDGAPIPKDTIAKNVLEEMNVPQDKLDYVHEIIMEEGQRLGIITTLKDKKYVEIPKGIDSIKKVENKPDGNSVVEELSEQDPEDSKQKAQVKDEFEDIKNIQRSAEETGRLKRVFITHGKNRDFIDPIKKLLKFGELEAVVSVERTSVSVPVPDKVLNEMRSCGSAIIHVEGEMNLIDKDAKEHTVLNPNVLIEIGAAMALYGRRFILLVKDGAKLPSNLQGLFEVRYTGEALDGNATIRLLEAINDIKTQRLPE
jgi:predicted nucleotide-binding protein